MSLLFSTFCTEHYYKLQRSGPSQRRDKGKVYSLHRSFYKHESSIGTNFPDMNGAKVEKGRV